MYLGMGERGHAHLSHHMTPKDVGIGNMCTARTDRAHIQCLIYLNNLFGIGESHPWTLPLSDKQADGN